MCMLSPIFVLSTGYNVHCLADIIKKYNPDVKGFSLGKGDVNSDNAHLNVANPGDQARSAGVICRELFIVTKQYESCNIHVGNSNHRPFNVIHH